MIPGRGFQSTRDEEVARRDAAGPLEAVRSYIDAFNKGDVKVMAALFDTSGSILDGMATHVWQGPTACEDWYGEV